MGAGYAELGAAFSTRTGAEAFGELGYRATERLSLVAGAKWTPAESLAYAGARYTFGNR